MRATPSPGPQSEQELASGIEETLDGSVAYTGATPPEHPSSQSIDDLIGTTLGERYLITERLGQGGMGAVFKARHIVLDHMLAVKVLLKPQDTDAQRRFFHEAKLASKLTHPNTVKISDFGVAPDGRSYLVMELLSGPTLSKVLEEEAPLVPLRACKIAVQIARGLHAVHEQGSVHRDLKPENIFLLDQDGQRDFVKIVDFGIALHGRGVSDPGSAANRRSPSDPVGGEARAATPSTPSHPSIPEGALDYGRMTMPGSVLGTPHYMSPEQAAGWPVDARSDQYALGCILYEMLVGEVPFDAATLRALLIRHIEQLAEPPRKRRPGLQISDGLEALVMRLLAKDPQRRFPSMREVEQALAREIAEMERGVERPPAPRRRPRVWLLAPALALSLVGGYVALRLLRPRPGSEQPAVSATELAALRRLALEALQRDLRDPVATVRRGALQRLEAAGEAGARPQVEALLGDPDPEVRAQAALTLGALGDRAAVAALRPLLAAELPPNVRAAAAGALDQLGEPAGTTLLLSALSDASAELRRRAAFLLCDRGSAPAVLQELAASAPADEQLALLGRLVQCGSAGAREQLQKKLAGPPERALQAAALLAQSNEAAGRSHLAALASRPGPLQLPAARLLASPEEPALNTLFRRTLETEQAVGAQILALEGLGLGGQRGDAPQVGQRLQRASDPAVRQAAAAAVLQIVAREPGGLTERGLLWARGALVSGDWVARQTAAEVLAGSRSAEATALLTQLVKDSDVRVRRSAVRALGARRDRAALELLRGGLQDTSAEVRRDTLVSIDKVANFLFKAGASSLGQELSGWLRSTTQDGSAEEQLLASGLLLSLGDQSQREHFLSFLSSPEESLRLLAVQRAPRVASLLAPLLRDVAYAVRFAAAMRLADAPADELSAEQRERVRTVLHEGVARGGADGLNAYARLQRLGEAGPPLSELLLQLKSGDAGARIAAVEACGHLPPNLAMELLRSGLRDPEPLVRQMVAEVAAELSPPGAPPLGLPLLRQLVTDRDARVRARAQLLLAGVLPPETSPPVGNAAAPAPAAPAAPSAPSEPSEPARSAPASEPAARPSAADPSSATSAASAASTAPASAPGAAPAAGDKSRRADPLFEKALRALDKKDSERARKQIEKATSMCLAGKLLGGECGKLAYQSGTRLGQLYEREGQWGEAMAEYDRLSSHAAALALTPEQSAQLVQARARIEPRVGRIIMPKRTGSRCQELTIWMKVGSHQIEVDEQTQIVTVRAGEVTRVGSCK
ncbi:MAG: HEAT repeat domain-containing protein [Polyangia bacterium]